MRVPELLRAIRKLPEELPPITASLYRQIHGAPGWVEHRTPKEHLLGFWGQYTTEGYYGRIPGLDHSASYAFNHFKFAPDLLWLAEAAGVPKTRVAAGKRAIVTSDQNVAMRSAAFRRVVPWEAVALALRDGGWLG